MEFTLVRATSLDVDTYLRIAEDSVSEYNLPITDPIKVLKEIEESFVFFVKVSGEIVGLISYEIQENAIGYISEFAILSSMRGQGIGGAVLEMVVGYLKGQNMKMVELVTHPNGDAMRLYERHGFQADPVVIPNYKNSGTPRVYMRRKLDI
jgi:ribosomal protein S18 acetylase RimI-like enzyme